MKFAVALCAEVTACTSTAAKDPDGRALGAHTVAVATSPDDFAADVEVFPSSQVDVALDRLRRGEVRHRFVLDMSDL